MLQVNELADEFWWMKARPFTGENAAFLQLREEKQKTTRFKLA